MRGGPRPGAGRKSRVPTTPEQGAEELRRYMGGRPGRCEVLDAADGPVISLDVDAVVALLPALRHRAP